MTPQEHDLITALLERLSAQANLPKDPEADALIRRGMAEQPDAPYLLTQTVLIQDLALGEAQRRIAELERQAAPAKPAAEQPASFLGGAGRGTVPSARPWATSPVPAQGAPAPGGNRPAGSAAAAALNPAPGLMAGAGSGFLRQAATTAAGIAGGALLFQGIQSLFGPHWGGGFLPGNAIQPGLSETVIDVNDDRSGADLRDADAAPPGGTDATDYASTDDPGVAPDADQGIDAEPDLSDQDFGSDDNYDV
jgi:hypothetical protein